MLPLQNHGGVADGVGEFIRGGENNSHAWRKTLCKKIIGILRLWNTQSESMKNGRLFDTALTVGAGAVIVFVLSGL